MTNPKQNDDQPRQGWREAFEKEKARELTQEDIDFINMPPEDLDGDEW